MDDIKESILCCPNDPDDAKLLSEVQGQKIDEVFIGPCMTNIGHYRAAGKMLNMMNEGQLPTRLWIAPPAKMDHEQLTKEGVGARTEMLPILRKNGHIVFQTLSLHAVSQQHG